MIKGFLIGLLIGGLCFSAYLIHHLGFFKPVTITEESRGPLYLLYRDHIGAYYKISEVISQVESVARQNSLDCQRTFGEFLDNPHNADEDRLRSRGGCISTEPFPNVPEGLLTSQKPPQRYVVARFLGSPAVGPWKVYPKALKYVQDHRINIAEETIEIYTLNDDRISSDYLFPMK